MSALGMRPTLGKSLRSSFSDKMGALLHYLNDVPMTANPSSGPAVLPLKLVDGRYGIQSSVTLVYLAVQSFCLVFSETLLNTV